MGLAGDTNSLNSESEGRLAIYRSLKFSPRTENYLEEVLNPGHRYRSPRVPVSERVCKLCALEVENEFRFVMECPRLHEPRTLLFRVIQEADLSVNFLQLNSIDKFLYIMSYNVNCSLICKHNIYA